MTDKLKSQMPERTTETKPHRRTQDWFGEMQEDMARWMGGWPFSSSIRRLMPTALVPKTDVFDRNGRIHVKADLPGVKPEDLHVTFEDGDLVIKGEYKSETETKDDQYYWMERSSGSFYRRIPLPAGVDATKIEAHLKDGLLEVEVPQPMAKPVQAQRIQVTTAGEPKAEATGFTPEGAPVTVPVTEENPALLE